MNWLRPDERIRINSNWNLQPDGKRIFTKGVTNDRKTLKNKRFQRIVTRKFQGASGLPIDLINMADQAYDELNKVRKTLSDPDTRFNISKFTMALRKDISDHLKSIPYDDKSEKHKLELVAYNDFLYHYYFNKGDKLKLTKEASERLAESLERQRHSLNKERKSKVEQDRAEKILIQAELESYAHEIIQKWCVTIKNYRTMYRGILPAVPIEASSLCSAMNSSVAAPATMGGRTRKMRRH